MYVPEHDEIASSERRAQATESWHQTQGDHAQSHVATTNNSPPSFVLLRATTNEGFSLRFVVVPPCSAKCAPQWEAACALSNRWPPTAHERGSEA